MEQNSANKRPAIFGIAGWKNSGKTTLVEKLIAEFTKRGLVVSAIKHAHHSFEIDHENRDSYKFRFAGARRTAIISGNRWAMIHELRGENEPQLGEILSHIGECDLVLVEGYKREAIPKIEIRKASDNKEKLADSDPDIVAIAFQDKVQTEKLPTFDASNITEIADFIITQVL